MNREEQKRDDLLERSIALLFKEGLSALTMESIAARIGISKRTLYKYFPRKELLIEAAVQRRLDTVALQVEALEGLDLPFPELLRRFLTIVQATIRPAATVLVRDIMQNAPWLWEKIDRFRHERIFTFLARLLEKGGELGYLRTDVDRRIIPPLYVAIIERIAQPDFILAQQLSLSEFIETVVKIMLGGILNEKGRSQFTEIGGTEP
jgi:AcrR family transcriptional regulator